MCIVGCGQSPQRIKMELAEKQERYNILVSRIVTNKGVTTSAIYQIGLDLKEILD